MTELLIITLLERCICLFDSLAVAGYGAMTFMVYLSAVVPSIKELAAHGKTRLGNNSNKATTANTTATLWNTLVNGDFWMVKKKNFRHFYVMGILVLTATLYLATILREKTSFSSLLVASSVLLYIHLFRRLYECTFVHKWKDTSVMHIAGYLVGAIHYVWLPMVFVRLPCEACLRDMWNIGQPSSTGTSSFLDAILFHQYSTGPLWIENRTLPSVWWRLPPILLCLFGQYQQHVHHVILADMRKPSSDNSNNKGKPVGSSYSLPSRGWFRYVTCPHYFAEVLVYVSFAILLAQEQVQGNRHFVVLFWVASNLTLSALTNLKWYKDNLPAEIMKGRKAIFPFIL